MPSCLYDYVVGEMPRLAAEFRVGNTLTDPDEVRFKYRKPSDIETRVLTYGVDAEIVHDSVGKYYIDLDLDEAGTWKYRFESDGVETAGQKQFRVARENV